MSLYDSCLCVQLLKEELSVPITHIEVNDYFKLFEAVVVWRKLLKLF